MRWILKILVWCPFNAALNSIDGIGWKSWCPLPNQSKQSWQLEELCTRVDGKAAMVLIAATEACLSQFDCLLLVLFICWGEVDYTQPASDGHMQPTGIVQKSAGQSAVMCLLLQPGCPYYKSCCTLCNSETKQMMDKTTLRQIHAVDTFNFFLSCSAKGSRGKAGNCSD